MKLDHQKTKLLIPQLLEAIIENCKNIHQSFNDLTRCPDINSQPALKDTSKTVHTDIVVIAGNVKVLREFYVHHCITTGMSVKSVSELFDVTPVRIRQIVRKYR